MARSVPLQHREHARMHGKSESADLKRALLDPGAVFSVPEEVVHHPKLTRQEKIEILRRWGYDASALCVAEEEGMMGGEPIMLHRILQALHRLMGEVDVSHSPPTKQEGI